MVVNDRSLLKNAFGGRKYIPDTHGQYFAETSVKYMENLFAYRALKEPSVMLLPFGLPLPLKDVHYFEVGKSMDTLQYRSVGSVFMAQQKGGNWGVRIDARLTGAEQTATLTALQWLFENGKARKFKKSTLDKGDVNKYDDVRIAQSNRIGKWATVDTQQLHLDAQGSPFGVNWSKNEAIFASHIEKITGNYVPLPEFTTGNNRAYRGALPQAVKTTAKNEATFLKAMDTWSKKKAKGNWAIHLDVTTGTWECVWQRSKKYKASIARGIKYHDTAIKGGYLDTVATFAYPSKQCAGWHNGPKDKKGIPLEFHTMTVIVGEFWSPVTGGSGQHRMYLAPAIEINDPKEGVKVDKTELDFMRTTIQDRNSDVTVPDDYTWDNGQWHHTFTVMSKYDVLFNMYIETFSWRRTVKDGIDGIEVNLLLRKHIMDKKFASTHLQVMAKNGRVGGELGTLQSGDSLRTARVVKYKDHYDEAGMFRTDTVIATIHAVLYTSRLQSTYELDKYKSDRGVLNFTQIIPINSNKGVIDFGRI